MRARTTRWAPHLASLVLSLGVLLLHTDPAAGAPSRASEDRDDGALSVRLPRVQAPRDFGRLGDAAKWARVEITFPGPPSRGRGTPNPFDVRLDVSVTSSRGRTYRVPGFYDGDGDGGLDGTLWRVRFAAERAGDVREGFLPCARR